MFKQQIMFMLLYLYSFLSLLSSSPTNTPSPSLFRPIHQFYLDQKSNLFRHDVSDSFPHDPSLLIHSEEIEELPHSNLSKRSLHVTIKNWLKKLWPFGKSKTKFPSVTNPQTIQSFAKLCANAYYRQDEMVWTDVLNYNQFKVNSSLGWDNNGLRSYVFSDLRNDLLIIAFKGTSVSIPPFGAGSEVSASDRFNDNLIFSCCGGGSTFQGPSYQCHIDDRRCDTKCVHENLLPERYSYYRDALKVYESVKTMYPKSTIWLTGHSLGGGLASLVALTYNVPAVTFNSPGDLLYAQRIGLIPKTNDLDSYLEKLPIWHIGTDHDPVFMGRCYGILSWCNYGGYALETKCHAGKVATYNEQEYKGSNPSNRKLREQRPIPGLRSNPGTGYTEMRFHSIDYMTQMYFETWDYVPTFHVQYGCEDCRHWTFY